MSKAITSRLIMEVIDRVSGPARAISRSISGIGGAIRNSGGAQAPFADRLTSAIERNNAALDTVRGRLFDAVAGYYALSTAIGAPLRTAADFETQLEDIGQKAGIAVDRLPALGEKIKGVARETNAAASDIARSIDALVGRGADIDTALAAANPIGRAAAAYRASTEDLAAAAYSAVTNLAVPADQIGGSMDAMAYAGKQGAFELRDMARYFPSIGAAYQALGQDGVDAVADLSAALQVVRTGTGDSSTAATNLLNVLQKMRSPATVRAFRRMGVDLEKSLAGAAERGLTPIEAIAEITAKTLNGDLSKIGYLFEDAQAQAGIRSLIQGMEDFKRIRAEAMGADGTVDRDFERRIGTAQGAIDRWKASVERLQLSFATGLLPVLNQILDAIIPVLDRIGAFIAANSELSGAIAQVVGGLVLLKSVFAGLRFVGLLGKGGALQLAALALGGVGAAATTAAEQVEASVARQNAALARLRFAGITSGIMAALSFAKLPDTAEELKRFQAANRKFMEDGLRTVPVIGDLMKGYERLFQKINGARAPSANEQAREAELHRAIATLEGFDPASVDRGRLEKRHGELTAKLAELQSALENGRNPFAFDPEMQRVAAELREVEAQIAASGDRAKDLQGALAAVGITDVSPTVDPASIDRALDKARQLLSALERTRTVIGGGSESAGGRFGGGRAKGGPISRGGSYLVGEEGPELITASRSGYVNPTGSRGAGSGVTVTNHFTLNVSGRDDAKTIAERVAWMMEERAQKFYRGIQADVGVYVY